MNLQARHDLEEPAGRNFIENMSKKQRTGFRVSGFGAWGLLGPPNYPLSYPKYPRLSVMRALLQGTWEGRGGGGGSWHTWEVTNDPYFYLPAWSLFFLSVSGSEV